MNRSTKFNFFLPQNTDPIEVSDFNSNFETIDANLLTKAQSLTEAQKAAVRANVDLNVANNLTTTAAGSVLDARQGNELNNKILYSVFPVYSGTSIGTATDFNSLVTPGVYTIYQDGIAQSSSNCPSTYAGKLCVFSLSGNPFTSAWQYGCQTYKDRVGNEFVRAVSSNSSGAVTFGSWGKIVLDNDISEFVVSTSLRARRFGKVVCLNGFTNVSISGQTNLGTLPSGYRPYDIIRGFCNVGPNAYSLSTMAYVSVGTNGVVTVTPPNSNSYASVYMSLSWIIAG
jgi:hypothetical protein